MPRAAFKFPPLTAKQRDVDELGRLREKIKELADNAAKIEKRLKKYVGAEIHGQHFDAKIWVTGTRTLSKAKLLRYITQKQLDSSYEPGKDKVTVKTIRKE